MGRTLKALVVGAALLGTMQAPVAEAHDWFHPIRDVKHAAHAVEGAGDAVGNFAKRAGTDALGAIAYQPSRAQLLASLGLLAFGVGVMTANPILIGIGVGLNTSTAISWGVRSYQYDRATHGKDPGFSIGPIYIPSNLDLPYGRVLGSNVGRNAATRDALAYIPSSTSGGPNMGMHH